MSHLLKNDSAVFLSNGSALHLRDRMNWDIVTLPVPGGVPIYTTGMLLDRERRRLFVGTYPTGKIIVYNADTLEIDTVIDLNGRGFTDIRLDEASNRYLMFSTFSGFYPIDRDTLGIGELIPGGGSRSFELDRDRNQVITADFTGALCILGLPDFNMKYRFYSSLTTVVRKIKADPMNPEEFYIITTNGPLIKLNAATLALRTINLPYGIYDIAFDPSPESNRIYASGYSDGGGLSAFDANTWALLSNNLGAQDTFIAFDNSPDRVRYFIAGGYLPKALTKIKI
ncbi:hypothetical protein SNE26_20305 [Mucilaginibacter sp. cycad4]|uniref:hypothetical protein n=1 Tax=Mucilaginibacter sp. cycad4 TaxID=3342096 RepID=UPI002AAC3B20|nr:hypothetical protein [Mucilaginibacter gossypii]WPU98371.1 hypothetical protein SNE26_20305 [Mucilaginibacter gossypii]